MPVPAASTARTASVTKSAGSKSRPQKQTTKSRVVRRRGRRRDGLDSDDEIQREARSDDDSDSELSSASSTETEPASEDVVPRILTPSTRTPEDRVPLEKAMKMKPQDPSFFSSSSWSEMVADETANGPADLPVIDFSDFNGRSLAKNNTKVRTRKPKKGQKKTQPQPASSLPSPPLSTQEVADEEPQEEQTNDTEKPSTTHPPPPRRSSFPPRPFGQSARQAYQQRLDDDPSYVPTVGEFWGHDDRLMDKNLRSLSGWWRGRWQGRGRGFAMRGRGGFTGRSSRLNQRHDSPSQDQPAPGNVSPVEKNWTHDGFEEMKKHEERRRGPPQPQLAPRGNFRSKGNFVPPARGRAGFTFSPRSRGGGPPLHPPGRVWFAMKPQLMWTKQHDSFLYQDSSLRVRPGEDPAIRVKLPGGRGRVVRPPLKQQHSQSQVAPVSVRPSTATSSVHGGSDYAGLAYVVRVPKPTQKTIEKPAPSEVNQSPVDDVFKVRPRLVSAEPIPLPEPSNVRARSASTANQANFHPPVPHHHLPNPVIQQQLENLSIDAQNTDPLRQAQTEGAVMRNPTESNPADPSSARPAPPPLQTTFPPPHPSSAYSSPYAYPSTLSPGVAVNQLGVPYELATGRPVYMPSPMYNPNGLVPPPMPYVPGHMRHHSTVEYMSPTHGPAFVDPATGVPVFSFPRQSSAIPIRSPSESDSKSPTAASKPAIHQRNSTLNTNAPVFEPGSTHVRFPSLSTSADSGAVSYPSEPPVEQQNEMMYPPYYYYPDAYGYSPYLVNDMQYGGDGYGQDSSQVPMGTVYYT